MDGQNQKQEKQKVPLDYSHVVFPELDPSRAYDDFTERMRKSIEKHEESVAEHKRRVDEIIQRTARQRPN